MVSVIIPVYNSEKTLECCIKSLVAQSYKDFEIVMIDDGSTDGSGKLCDELCEKYGAEGYTLRVIHQENGGVSAARNRGMEEVRGEYFVCVDSDDEVTESYIRDMVELQESDGDYGCVGCALKSMNITGECYVFSKDEPISVRDRKDYMELFGKEQVQSPCLHLYRTELVRGKQLRMREDLCNGEDLIFNLEYFNALENTKFGIINKANYIYNDGGESLNWGYRKDMLRDYTEIDAAIKKHLIKWDVFSGDSRTAYYNTVFYHLSRVLENTFNKNNRQSLLKKIRFNNKVLRSVEFREALEGCNSCPRRIVKAAYKSGRFPLVVLATQACGVLGRIARMFTAKGRTVMKEKIKDFFMYLRFAMVGWGIDWKNPLLVKDLEEWKEQYRLIGMSDKKATAILLQMKHEFCNLLLYRNKGGFWRRWFKLWYKPYESLDLNTPNMGGGLFIQHGFSTGISAVSVGEKVWINHEVTVGASGTNGKNPVIGNGVVLCCGAKVLGGVTVGDNAIVGANAVVVKDVAPNTIVGGIPAKYIKDVPVEERRWKS